MVFGCFCVSASLRNLNQCLPGCGGRNGLHGGCGRERKVILRQYKNKEKTTEAKGSAVIGDDASYCHGLRGGSQAK